MAKEGVWGLLSLRCYHTRTRRVVCPCTIKLTPLNASAARKIDLARVVVIRARKEDRLRRVFIGAITTNGREWRGAYGVGLVWPLLTKL